MSVTPSKAKTNGLISCINLKPCEKVLEAHYFRYVKVSNFLSHTKTSDLIHVFPHIKHFIVIIIF